MPVFRVALLRAFLIAFGLTATAQSFALAQTPAAPVAKTQQQEMEEALAAAEKVQQRGPRDITLLDQATLHMPDGFTFVPAAESLRLLRAMGNRPGNDVAGMIFGSGSDDDWMLVIRFEKSGYIKDDDARNWDADELLKSLREGTEQANEERRSRGIPEIEVVGWVEKPAYDAATQRLIWSASTRRKGAAADAGQGVNYNTYALGREGYFSLNLVTELAKVERNKPMARRLLAALDYNDGKRYSDFNSSTDSIAEYGLAALVGGIAAKKLGLLAAAGVLLLKFWKLLAIGAVVFGGAIVKIFRGRSRSV